jgi:dihydropteroate synthase
MPRHHAVYIADQDQAISFLQDIGCDPGSYPYMAPKAVHRCIKLKDISPVAANIIKQEMLSRGGEAAIARAAINGQSNTDVLLMGTLRQYGLLIDKLKKQPLGLKDIAAELEAIITNLDRGTRIMKLANGQEMELGSKTLIMGILNVTPDSFSDGGKYMEGDLALARAAKMLEEGADIIDIGGASSRPNSVMVDEEEELRRVLPVLKGLANQGVIISVDTFRSRVAKAALDHGAHIINDIGALKLDEAMLPFLCSYGAPVILMHNRMQLNQGQPYNDLIADILAELGESADRLKEAGFDPSKIMVDPGIGFGKNVQQNLLIIKQLTAFKGLGYPVVIGLSRKSFIGQILNLKVEERLEGSLGLMAVGIMQGADIIRVHDVKESKRLAQIVDQVVR